MKLAKSVNNNMQSIIKDIEELQGTNVSIFGQTTKLPLESDRPLVPNILNALYEMEGKEVDLSMYLNYLEIDSQYSTIGNPNLRAKDNDEIIWDILEALEENGDIKEVRADNSYNWNCNLNHEFNMTIYDNEVNGNIWIEFRAHRFGDVRANYTDTVVLEFDDIIDFYDCFYECDIYGYIDIDGTDYDYSIRALGEGIEISLGGDCIELYEFVETEKDLEKAIREYLLENEMQLV